MNTVNINYISEIDSNVSIVLSINNLNSLETNTYEILSKEELHYLLSKKPEEFPVFINQYKRHCIILLAPSEDTNFKKSEKNRILGFEIFNYCKTHNINQIQICTNNNQEIDIAEGLALSSYNFEKYKTKNTTPYSLTISVQGDKNEIEYLKNTTEAVFFARDLVNEPQSYLTANQLSNEIEEQCKKVNISFTRFDLDKIKALKMGGLLAVNQGSIEPPTFNILEYKPLDAQNSKPIILVGKGVVYDTGGLSLKPTPNSMDIMKCDMGGAATVAGALLALAKNKIPYYVVALIPATDNRPGGNAYTPGDVITMYNGTTVEVLNTDAEGRIILADALTYASKYNPELVIDVATLTGSAMRAIGKEATVMLSNADESIKNKLKTSGNNVYERLVEFPLWDEYAESLKSDIADIKNLGETNAGAISAAKFLETFTNYPWVHLDIAAPAYLDKKDKYRGKNATGVGVRLLYDFVKKFNNV